MWKVEVGRFCKDKDQLRLQSGSGYRTLPNKKLWKMLLSYISSSISSLLCELPFCKFVQRTYLTIRYMYSHFETSFQPESIAYTTAAVSLTIGAVGDNRRILHWLCGFMSAASPQT